MNIIIATESFTYKWLARSATIKTDTESTLFYPFGYFSNNLYLISIFKYPLKAGVEMYRCVCPQVAYSLMRDRNE